MPTEADLLAAAARLRARSMPSDAEELGLFRKAIDPTYWQGLLPTMAVEDQRGIAPAERAGAPSDRAAQAANHLEAHGYFQMPPTLGEELTDRMATAVELLRGVGWPLVFTYIYDEFWAVWRAPSVVSLLRGHFGGDYVQTAGVWTYRVDPQRRASGWPPHVDSVNDAERLSIWIPLTDATVGNGCMYVIPADAVPTGLPTSFLDWSSVSVQDLCDLLHNVTPLPAPAGSVMGWNNRLIHWGGRATTESAGLRISVAAEFLGVGTKPRSSELPVLGLQIPDFRARLRIIGQAILAYEKFEPSMIRYSGIAKRLIDWAASEAGASAI